MCGYRALCSKVFHLETRCDLCPICLVCGTRDSPMATSDDPGAAPSGSLMLVPMPTEPQTPTTIRGCFSDLGDDMATCSVEERPRSMGNIFQTKCDVKKCQTYVLRQPSKSHV